MNERETEVANLVAAGFEDREIAAKLGVDLRMVKEHKRRAVRRMGYRGKRLNVFLVRAVCGGVVSQSRLETLRTSLRRTAELAAQGMTNAEIGALLGKARYTVDNYMREIFDRAGVWNRRGLVAWLLEEAPATQPITDSQDTQSQFVTPRQSCESDLPVLSCSRRRW